MTARTMRLSAGGREFVVALEEGAAADALIDMLPMTMDMRELNGNEKYRTLGSGLPTDEIRPGRINAGDVMLFGDDCLVVFYRSFDSGYRYTPIGRVTDPSGLAEALGRGDVTVSLAL